MQQKPQHLNKQVCLIFFVLFYLFHLFNLVEQIKLLNIEFKPRDLNKLNLKLVKNKCIE